MVQVHFERPCGHRLGRVVPQVPREVVSEERGLPFLTFPLTRACRWQAVIMVSLRTFLTWHEIFVCYVLHAEPDWDHGRG